MNKLGNPPKSIALLQHLAWRPTWPANQPAHLANARYNDATMNVTVPASSSESRLTGSSMISGTSMRSGTSCAATEGGDTGWRDVTGLSSSAADTKPSRSAIDNGVWPVWYADHSVRNADFSESATVYLQLGIYFNSDFEFHLGNLAHTWNAGSTQYTARITNVYISYRNVVEKVESTWEANTCKTEMNRRETTVRRLCPWCNIKSGPKQEAPTEWYQYIVKTTCQ